LGGDHPMHPFIIDTEGTMYVDVATATNSCQLEKSDTQVAWRESLYGAGDPWRHLAL
jgi:hypothetical protein